MAGASAIFGLGMLESGITFDFLQAVLDNDIARMIRFTVKGVATTDEFLALDDIKSVGHTGHFMASPMTYKYMRSILSAPETFERHNRERWETSGMKNAEDVAREKLKTIFHANDLNRVSSSVRDDIRKLCMEAEHAEGVKTSDVPFDLTEDYFTF